MGSARSHRSRGAWIEIQWKIAVLLDGRSRIAHAVRGLKSITILFCIRFSGRIAHAVRGLKSGVPGQ